MATKTFTTDEVIPGNSDIFSGNIIRDGFVHKSGGHTLVANGCTVTIHDAVFVLDGTTSLFTVANGGKWVFGQCENEAEALDQSIKARPITSKSCTFLKGGDLRGRIFSGEDSDTATSEFVIYGGKFYDHKGGTNFDIRAFGSKLTILNASLENAEIWSNYNTDGVIAYCHIFDAAWAFDFQGKSWNNTFSRIRDMGDYSRLKTSITDLYWEGFALDFNYSGSSNMLMGSNPPHSITIHFIDTVSDIFNLSATRADNVTISREKTLEFTPKDEFGIPLSVNYKIEGETASAGTSSGFVKVLVFSKTTGNNPFTDVSNYTISLRQYGFLPVGVVEYNFVDTNEKEVYSPTFLLDPNITASKTTANSYSDINTDEKTYEYICAKIADDFDLPEGLVVKEGSTNNFKNYNIIIDDLASDLFTFSGNTITLKKSTTGSIATTGTITLKNGATLEGGTYNHVILESGFEGVVTFENANITALENKTGNNIEISLKGSSATPSTLIATNGTLDVLSVLMVTDISEESFKLIAWDDSNVSVGSEIKAYSDNIYHEINTVGISSVRIAVDKPGGYAKIYTIPITSTDQGFLVNMTASPSVDINVDITDLIAATSMSMAADPYGLGFDVLRATIDGDFKNITAAQWRRYHDYFSEDENGLTILALNNLNGDMVYNTNESGVAIMRPVLEVYADSLSAIATKAYIDTTAAEALYPLYDYSPRNSQNVSVETATVNPLIDYDQLAIAVDNRLGPVIRAARDHAACANQQTQSK